MPGKSVIPQHDLILVARALAAGKPQAQFMREVGWDTNRMRRCVDRLRSDILYEAERVWQRPIQVALEWLRLRGLSTPTELDAVVRMAREHALPSLKSTLEEGDRLQKARDFAGAERTYLWYLRDDPYNVDVLAEYGLCLVELNRLNAALDRFNQVLSTAPDHVGGRFGRAIALERAGSFAAARVDLERAHRLEPDNLFFLTVLAGWRLRWPAERTAAVTVLNDTMVQLLRRHAARTATDAYCRQIAGMVFSALWNRGLIEEALAGARISQQQGWSSARMDEAVRFDAQERANALHSFSARVRAKADGRAEHWPDDTDGYTVTLSIIAQDVKEAETLGLDYLHSTEPPSIRFEVDLQPSTNQIYPRPEPGVSQDGPRQWIRLVEQVQRPVAPERIRNRQYQCFASIDRTRRRPAAQRRRRDLRH